ncbi:hypothetical protein [Klebsiella phage Kpn74]|uniref:Uncharacterized protein n=1 Tax=Klebsiella phage Kpn74 TaxID=3044026 RepID=A0AAT9V5C9_9CAUD|nr:hypothetical protein [Klebsiella phage Kpn74]
MASINELANNPKMKLSQADKTVVSNALKQMDLSALADRFKGLEKAFTWGDRLLKAEKIRDGVVTGVTTGTGKSWRLRLKLCTSVVLLAP